MDDKIKKKRDRVRGEENVKSVLNNKEVLDIRHLHILGYSYKSIGDDYGISGEHVSAIVKRKIWKHL